MEFNFIENNLHKILIKKSNIKIITIITCNKSEYLIITTKKSNKLYDIKIFCYYYIYVNQVWERKKIGIEIEIILGLKCWL